MATKDEVPDWVWAVGVIGLIVLANMWVNGTFVRDDEDDFRYTPVPVIRPASNFGPAPLGDLDCADIGHEVYVGVNDPNGFDRDDDGIGCEGW